MGEWIGEWSVGGIWMESGWVDGMWIVRCEEGREEGGGREEEGEGVCV